MNLSDCLACSEPVIRLMHFTPQNRDCWCWCFFAPVMTLLPGLQPVITGGYVQHSGSQLLEGVTGAGHFASRDDAMAWAMANDVPLHSVEVA